MSGQPEDPAAWAAEIAHELVGTYPPDEIRDQITAALLAERRGAEQAQDELAEARAKIKRLCEDVAKENLISRVRSAAAIRWMNFAASIKYLPETHEMEYLDRHAAYLKMVEARLASLTEENGRLKEQSGK